MLAQSESPAHKGTPFSAQVDWPIPTQAVWNTLFPQGPAWPGLNFSSIKAGSAMTQLIYAEVWMRHLTALNDEAARDEAFNDAVGHPDWTTRPEVGDLIRERALGGPDTCTRLQTVAQVKHWDNLDPKTQSCDDACAALAKALPPKTIGTMLLDVTPTPPVTDPCQEPLQGGYGGAWNRTYRVEIHDPGAAGTATLKWSTENGAFCVRINGTALTSLAAGSDIIVTSIGKDQETQLSANDWVEVCGEETELGVFRNALGQVSTTPTANADGTWTVQLTGPVVLPHAPFLRRWSADTQTITLNSEFNLDAGSGLGVTFFDAAGASTGTTYFHAMDYWTWSSRVDIRAVEPQTLANVPQAAQGIERHYCCLALLTWSNQNGAITDTANTMCTPVFPPLTEIPVGEECSCCCAISVGDGVLTHGDYDSLDAAFAALPDTGKRGTIVVCIQEGVYQLAAPIRLTQDRVIIRGCGPNTFIEAPAGAFILESRNQILFDSLVIESQTAPVIAAHNVHELEIRDSRIRMSLANPPATTSGQSGYRRQTPALLIDGWLVNILRNEIRGSIAGGGIAILPGSGDITIDGNNIHKSPLPGVDFSYVLADTSGTLAPVLLNTSGASFETVDIRDNTFRDIDTYAILQNVTVTTFEFPFVAPVAPQIAKTTAKTAKVEAKPAGAIKASATVPPVKAAATISAVAPADAPPPPSPGLIADLTIERNLITHCGLGSSIDLRGESKTQQETAAKLDAAQPTPEAAIQIYFAERILIASNQIVRNGQRNPIFAGIIIVLCEALVLRQNVIGENGRLVKTLSVNSGGVLISFAFPELAKRRRESAADAEGWAAVVVEDNVIDSLNGSALRITGAGSMRIRGNTLSNRQPGPGLEGICLVIVNLGTAAESVMPAGLTGDYIYAGDPGTTVESMLTELGGMTMISDNQIVTLGGTPMIGYTAWVLSGDDLSFTNNQVRVKINAPVTVNTFAEAYTLRVVGNRFTEPLNTFNNSAVSCHGVGDMVVGACNQATHCLVFAGTDSTSTGLNTIHPTSVYGCVAVNGLIARKPTP
jgi:hypothetical protein